MEKMIVVTSCSTCPLGKLQKCKQPHTFSCPLDDYPKFCITCKVADNKICAKCKDYSEFKRK